MTNAKNDQEEEELPENKVWQSREMMGEWNGTGRWNDDKQWSGRGTWQGGLLSGTWNGTGKWESVGNGKGNWIGNGDLISNMPFYKYSPLISFVMKGLALVASIVLVAIVANGLISNGLIIGGGIVAIVLLFVVSGVIGGRETAKGEWSGEGTWKDDGKFRILDMSARWKLGIHTGKIKGKMKDPK